MPKVSALHVYPVKSCGGVARGEVQLDARGPVGDRRFMIVDNDGMFLTQRSVPKLALIEAELRGDQLVLHAPGHGSLSVSLSEAPTQRRQVRVWSSDVDAVTMGPLAYQWLSDVLGTEAELVHMDAQSARTANTEYAPPNTHVSFADGYPILLISQASLDDLNARMTQSLPMNRFRPNLVVSGTDAFEEDSWARIRIGDVVLDVVKPCDRCVTTTIDQATGVAGKEPLKTLATYRKRDHKIYFGQNLVHRGFGTLRVGDDVEVLERRAAPTFGQRMP